MDIFEFRNRLVNDYSGYIRSFIKIKDERIRNEVDERLDEGLLWPEPLIQLNPSFEPGDWVGELVDQGVLHTECRRVFQVGKPEGMGEGQPLRLHKHQSDAIRIAHGGHNYVLTTGTGSGKSLSYIVPIVDHVLRQGSGKGIQAIVVYPMNALANSQEGELTKFLCNGYPDGKGPATFARYTGQESDEDRSRIMSNPPDIILTNYVMLEYILTRTREQPLIKAAGGLKFLVLDELHTYRGRQGADVSLLVRRVRDRLAAESLQCVGTSATLAGMGTLEQQQEEVARVASQLFGATVKPAHIIGETLRRTTPDMSFDDPNFVNILRERIADPNKKPPTDYQGFINDPLSVWTESMFGITMEPGSGRLIRSTPRSISGPDGASSELSRLSGVSEELCAGAIREGLLAGYVYETDPATGRKPFAFRLHQFISRGDTVYASLEPEDERYITVQGQQYVPGDRNRKLLPLVFCRECGQEYYNTFKIRDPHSGRVSFKQRDLFDRGDQYNEAGYLYLSTSNPWPDDSEELFDRLPEDWIDQTDDDRRVRSNRRKDLPQPIYINLSGEENDGIDNRIACHYIKAPFRFCLNCGVSYGFWQQSDFTKLASLGSGGRSTATTIMSLSAIRSLKNEPTLPERARKLLSFTDNRQDASLQAGHFNDFIEIGLLRSALYHAVYEAGDEGVQHDELTQKVFDVLKLPLEAYASNPEVKFQALKNTQQALRNVLGYRIYRDLERGWRITSPNLEQCGLLEIKYQSLDEACEAGDLWQNYHEALVTADPKTRENIAKVLLDYMRREMAIKVNYLDSNFQERIQQQSSQHLKAPWSLDENESRSMEHAAVLYPRSSRGAQDYKGNVYLSPRGGFGQYLRRSSTFPDYAGKLGVEDTAKIIKQLLEALTIAGLVEIVDEPNNEEQVPGYQVSAAAMLWTAGDGTTAFHDPIRVPHVSAEGISTNPFFVHFYREVAPATVGFEAREHTAQVAYEDRVGREERFREGRLPVLYCSPTMELGVDISELNVVNLRNIPPTPANYAQRSGRAGRSGQPALVFSYCATGSPHDQYYFKRPDAMVAGAVTPPRLDLANEDLVRAHIQAIWLAEANLSLGSSLQDILDIEGDMPSLALQQRVLDRIKDPEPKQRAKKRAERILESIRGELEASDWYSEGWLEEVFVHIERSFDDTCNRWRGLYESALRQAKTQTSIIHDASRSGADKEQAKRLRNEAEAQLKLLTEAENIVQSDFYSYRYFASEGFLPGYNFPRLPLSAYIPARRLKQKQDDEFLSRPRFLAISEFGPRAIIYHEGSRYIINKVIMPVGDDDLLTRKVKLCEHCGYLHPIRNGEGLDLCEHCKNLLGMALPSMFRLQNVSTRRRDRINSDEEERMRLGYDIITGVRFAEYGGGPASTTAEVKLDGELLARLTYGHAATLWRINLGWSRRKNKEQFGFVLDVERGYWAKNEQDEQDDLSDPMSAKTARVIPYVEDRRNCLIFEPAYVRDASEMASLQSALKSAIQARFQLEDNELAAEPLPSRDDRRVILLYEAAEGGAGVLRRLIDDASALAEVARGALQICHFDPDTGDDKRRAPKQREDCEAACYNCLMTYANQRDHILLDRQSIGDFLLKLTKASVKASPGDLPRAEHLRRLKNVSGSSLELKWLDYLEEHNYRLPSASQKLIEACKTRPDFLYEKELVAVYIDGPVHEYPNLTKKDIDLTGCMEDYGYTVIRFDYRDDWDEIISKYPNIFGTKTGAQS